MTEVQEHIWAWNTANCDGDWTIAEGLGIEYVRKDVSEAKIKALVEALRDVIGMLDDPTGAEHVRDMRGASVIARAAIAKAKEPK